MNWIEVGAGLVFRGGKLLITRRPEGAHLEGLWEFPGGKKEPAESFSECVARELLEELVIEVEVHELIESVEHRYPDKAVKIQFYRCAMKDASEPQVIGCSEFAWVRRDQLEDFKFPEADKKLLNLLQQKEEFWNNKGS